MAAMQIRQARAILLAGLMVLAWPVPLWPAQSPVQPVATPPGATAQAGNPALESSVIGVPYQQSITLSFPEATRVLCVDPVIIEAAILSPGLIQLRALQFGQTFLHIWTPQGRTTRAMQTTEPPPPPVPAAALPRRTAQDVARNLTFEYENRYRLQERGPRWKNLDLNTTTQFTHELAGQMQTPYGDASGRIAFQRIDSVNELSTWNAALRNGDMGFLENFDIYGGDVSAGFTDLTLPEGTVRGFDAIYYDLAPYKLEGFYGQRRLGFASGLSPSGQENNDVYFSGGGLSYDAKPLQLNFMYAGASGEDRSEIQTSQAMAIDGWYWMDESWRLGAEMGRTQDDAYGYRLKSRYQQGWLSFDTVYRNFSQRYENLLGRSAEQGERGVQLTASETPFKRWRLRQRLDWYDDLLFRNPAELDRSNLDLDLAQDIDITSSTLWTSGFARQRLLGRLFPTDTTTIRTGIRQQLRSLPLLTNGSVFGDYQYRKLRSVSSPESDFRSHQFILGLGAPLTRNFSWQLTQDWILLEETLTGDESIPRETAAGLNYSQLLPWFPLFVHSGINYSTSSSAQSANSFLSNEDRWTWDSGARYTFNSDMEAFVETRLLHTRRTTGKEIEFEVETGVRCFYDTDLRWEPSLSISGIVFEDANGNGMQEAGEAGLPHVSMQAGGAPPVKTDPGGRFYFGRVRGLLSEVEVDMASLPEGYVATGPTRREINLKKPPVMPLLFGFVAQSELRVRVFVDAQNNGQYDATDVPLDRVRIMLEDGAQRVTDRSGWAFFRGVKPGTYRVSLEVNDLAAGYVPATDARVETRLSEGKAQLVDFPITAQRSISGHVYIDRNRNARFDEEPVVKDIPICLDGAQRVRTREDGGYLFKAVSGGLHRISVNCGDPLPGLLPINATVQTIELAPQPADKEGVDFRFGEKEVIMQDVIADVLRQRSKQQEIVEEVIREKRQQPNVNP